MIRNQLAKLIDEPLGVVAIGCFMFVIFLVGVLAGRRIEGRYQQESYEGQIEAIRQSAVNRGAAEYDSKTGNWQWKDRAQE